MLRESRKPRPLPTAEMLRELDREAAGTQCKVSGHQLSTAKDSNGIRDETRCLKSRCGERCISSGFGSTSRVNWHPGLQPTLFFQPLVLPSSSTAASGMGVRFTGGAGSEAQTRTCGREKSHETECVI